MQVEHTVNRKGWDANERPVDLDQARGKSVRTCHYYTTSNGKVTV
jgi:hypothetical protein